MRFRVRYARPADLLADFEAQFSKGGLLVRVEAPEGASQFGEVELELVTLAGTVVLPAQIVQIVAGAGVALAFDATGDELHAAIEEARAAGESVGEAPEHSIVTGEEIDAAPEPEVAPAADGASAHESASASQAGAASAKSGAAAKLHAAMHGNKEERARIMREGDRSMHHYVLRNPGLRLDEVTSIAKMTTVSPDLLKVIAERREWFGRPEIALALVRNPKCPVPLAIRMLQHVGAQELRRLAKSGSVRMPILQAARKMVVG